MCQQKDESNEKKQRFALIEDRYESFYVRFIFPLQKRPLSDHVSLLNKIYWTKTYAFDVSWPV